MSGDLLLKNCRLYDAPAGAPLVNVLLAEGRIARIGAGEEPGAETLDAGGRTLIPGLIDLHIHGAGGADVQDGDAVTLPTLSNALARLGTTSFVATSFMRPASGDRHVDRVAEQAGASLGGARMLGLYLEGPFINQEKRGGIPPDAIYPYTPAALDAILDRADGTLRIMTVAPETPGALDAIERLAAAGVIPAFGHSNATYDETRAGIDAGIRHATHLFNAMPGLHHRAPGPLPALLDADGLTVELICDDVHVSRHVARLAARLFGRERCCCITDGMRTVGLPDGRYAYSGREFESRGGAARYLDGTLIGTSIPLLEIVRRFHRFTGCSFAEAVDTATRLPARILGVQERTGSIEVGKDADLVLLEEDFSVFATLVDGTVVEG
jgi:N-acetylglucosamine-6-phosphate deacetylase